MNKRSLPIATDSSLPREVESDTSTDEVSIPLDPDSAWEQWRSLAHPALKPDEQALHDALLGIAHDVGERPSRENSAPPPAELFLG